MNHESHEIRIKFYWVSNGKKQSSWKCTDTINASSVVNTDHGYILIQGAKARSYTNCTYMKGLIQSLIDDEKMSNNHAEVIEEFLHIFQEMLTTWNTNSDQIMFLLT